MFQKILIALLMILAVGAGVFFLSGKKTTEEKTTIKYSEDDEGTCTICLKGTPCYDSLTTLFYCRKRGSEKWCSKSGECIKP